jgi:hypothetical protein
MRRNPAKEKQETRWDRRLCLPEMPSEIYFREREIKGGDSMNKQAERTSTCTPCNHFRRCKVHWGNECKNMGGRRIPRMKSYPQEFHAELNEIQIETRQEKRNRIREVLDAVRTRVVGW